MSHHAPPSPASLRALLTALIALLTLPTDSPAIGLEELAECRMAVEAVYWKYRIWPASNLGIKPQLSEVLNYSETVKAAENQLRMNSALRDLWGEEITSREIQSELSRMARASRRPQVLEDLFRALGNDPDRIGECLVLPLLVERELRKGFEADDAIHRDVLLNVREDLRHAHKWPDISESRAELSEAWFAPVDQVPLAADAAVIGLDSLEWKLLTEDLSSPDAGGAREPFWHLPGGPHRKEGGNLESVIGGLGALRKTPSGYVVRALLEKRESAVLVGSAVWRKKSFADWWAAESPKHAPSPWEVHGLVIPAFSGRTGDNFDLPCKDSAWTPLQNEPEPRSYHTAIWTGSEMIVWGGFYWHDEYSTGGRYDPATDSWTPTSADGAPAPRFLHTAVWTGSRMIIWGGWDEYPSAVTIGDGASYDPILDRWTAIPAGNGSPSPRRNHSAVWAGAQMLIWGGNDNVGYFGDGASYDPVSRAWAPISSVQSPSARSYHRAVWTGGSMIIWGGYNGFQGGETNSGAAYDPLSNTWISTSIAGAPTPRAFHAAAWTGTEMLIWGGYSELSGSPQYFGDGARFDVGSNSWSQIPTVSAPTARAFHSAVWDGEAMLIWGGADSSTTGFASGAAFHPASNTWASLPTAGVSSGRGLHTAVWTGSEMIVWGGTNAAEYLSSGDRFAPASSTWVPTSSSGPRGRGRGGHAAVWTGAELVAWGGEDEAGPSATGDRYDPATDTWRTLPDFSAPSPRFSHTAVWTGSEAIVWGGYDNVNYLGTGARYNPTSDSWSPVTGVSSPIPRASHSATWSGTRMIVWGGYNNGTWFQSGGQYSPTTNSWTATSLGGAPSARAGHSAIWTGSRLIIWGGRDLGTGGIYDPAADSWTPIATTGAPSARTAHAAAWTGTKMIIWGGMLGQAGTRYNTGGIYDPSTDSWLEMSLERAPMARNFEAPMAFWTGERFLVWGISERSSPYKDGGRFDPQSNTWRPISTEGAPLPRAHSAAAWTGSHFIAWSGEVLSTFYRTGGAFCSRVLFEDGFESGGTMFWSSTQP
jgi:N-acetylneuraminic acid mutarotase